MESKPASAKLISCDEALAVLLREAPRTEVERCPLAEARGRVLREPVVADRDQPPFDRAAMDGFAVRASEIARDAHWPVVGRVAAGAYEASRTALSPGQAVRIATGAPLPPGADAVVQHELATVDEAADPPRVRFMIEQAEPWRNVHRRATDAAAGSVLLTPGTRLTPTRIGIAAAAGAVDVPVAARVRITLLTTGDEVVEPATATDALEPQQIRNSNGPMLRAMLESLGAQVIDHVHVPDEPEQTLAAAREALSRSHLVVTVGGVSAGERDWLPWAWGKLGLRTLVQGVAIQPGKPLFAATPSREGEADNRMVLGLPGNPVSVLVTAHLFLQPIIEQAMGVTSPGPHWRPHLLAEPVDCNPKRELFRAAKLNRDNRLCAITWRGSGDLAHTATADGWMRLPVQESKLEAGQTVMFAPLVS